MNEKLIITINSSIRECDSHLSGLRRSYRLMKEFFPLTPESLKKSSDETVEHIDQFICRFTKLQDAMGARLFPAVHSYLEGEIKPVPFLDILSNLEKYEVLSSEDEWQFFRNLRNNSAHDYPESIEQTVITLNTLFSRWDVLENLYPGVRNYCIEKVRGIDLN
jgi:hypothetical protein